MGSDEHNGATLSTGLGEPMSLTAASDGQARAVATAEDAVLLDAGYEEAGVSVSTTPPYVYAIGQIEARFPSLSIEKEFAQAAGRAETADLTDTQVFHEVLSAPQNRYLVSLLCWVLTVRDIDTFILRARDPASTTLLIDAIRPQPGPMDLDVVIGIRGPIAPPDYCNGLTVPIVGFDQIYSFDRDSFVAAIPRDPSMTDDQFVASSTHVLDSVLQVTDNAGATDEHRALNYLVMRYPQVYAWTATQFTADFALTKIDVQRSAVSADRKLMDCIFSYTSRAVGFTEKAAVSVDVTDEFPFLVTPMSSYYDRFGT